MLDKSKYTTIRITLEQKKWIKLASVVKDCTQDEVVQLLIDYYEATNGGNKNE